VFGGTDRRLSRHGANTGMMPSSSQGRNESRSAASALRGA